MSTILPANSQGVLFYLDIELRSTRFPNVLHVWRQLLLHTTPGTAIPLHHLRATSNVAVIKISLVVSIKSMTRGFIGSAQTTEHLIKEDHVVEDVAYSSALSM